jgi:uncharacterized protein (DUF302 family)
MQSSEQKGMVHLKSPYTAAETLDRLRDLVIGKGLALFATIDHAAAAAEVGLSMAPATVLIFGSPEAGTPLMIAAPTLAIDLPLKALVWQEPTGPVWLSYNAPEYLAQRHGLPVELLPAISGIRNLCEAAVKPG